MKYFFLCRATAVERSQMLMTKAMREKYEIREMRKYRFSLIRFVWISVLFWSYNCPSQNYQQSIPKYYYYYYSIIISDSMTLCNSNPPLSLTRVRFPDGLILQGTFHVNEKFEEVIKFVRENLVNDWRPFFLNLSGGGKVSVSQSVTMERWRGF